MASRFVSAGTDQESAPTNDDWTKARQNVESARMSKPQEQGKQEDGKSLYDVLQTNKLAKQEAFEEAAKLKNQFRALDDSEIEFLESIQENERHKEAAAKRETTEQLEIFRKQRAEAEQSALAAAQARQTAEVDPDTSSKDIWTSTKKRKRIDKVEETISTHKSRKSSTENEDKTASRQGTQPSAGPQNGAARVTAHRSSSDIQREKQGVAKPSTSLGLDAYGSDDSD